jgi:hypothetical protein
LSFNKTKNIIRLIEKYPEKVFWHKIIKNPCIISYMLNYDYQKMREKNRDFFEELVSKVFHPDRANRFAHKFKMKLVDYLESV